jgi:hypothetical protein
MGRLGVLIACFWALASAGALAQAQPQPQPAPQLDPLNGQFGALEIAPDPSEALNRVNLFNAALQGLRPQRQGQLDVYMLTLALWSDPVFEREAVQVESILRPHLNAEGRSIILTVGGQSPRSIYPVATPSNVAAALARIGQLINADEDLVVIYLTTHGAPDGAAVIQQGFRMNGALRPIHLSSMLSYANIRNRVVIVSACFAGAFIPPLANENTIVLTAAAADRTSFGCTPTNQWTFFGDALFNHAVRGGASLLSGFDQAKVLIEGWEREQNLSPPSNPQSFIGARAQALLDSAERAAH